MQSYNNLVVPELIKIRRLFATPLASIQHPDAERLNAQLKTIITHRMAQDRSGAQRSNEGGWQSTNDFPDWGGEACDNLVKFAKEFAVQLTAVHSDQYGLTEPAFEWLCACESKIASVLASAVHAPPEAEHSLCSLRG